MPTYGHYQTTRELLTSGSGYASLYVAQRTDDAAAAGPPAAAIKVLEPSKGLVTSANPQARIDQFLDAAAVQQQVAQSSPHWARVFDLGPTPGGAYVVMELFDHSADRLLKGRVRLPSAKLHALISQTVKGLADLRSARSRPHANLKPCNVFLRHPRIESADAVALADPLPSSLLTPKYTTATDLESVGRLLYSAVMGREFSNRVIWPIDASAEWDELGSTGQGWRSLCNSLLDPELPPDFPLDQVLSRLSSLRPGLTTRRALAAAALAALAAAVAIPLYLHHSSASTSDHTPPPKPPHPPDDPTTRQTPPLKLPNTAEEVLTGLMAARNPSPGFKLSFTHHIGPCRGGPGNCISFTVTSDRDCFLLLLTRDSAGNVAILLPNDSVPRPRLPANQPTEFPPRDLPLIVEWPIEPKSELLFFKLIATTRPLRLDGLVTKSVEDGVTSIVGISTLGLEDDPKRTTHLSTLLPPADWATADADVFTPGPAKGST